MTQTESGVRDNTGRALAARLAWVALILATLYICYFHNLGAIGLVGPDEPRYAWIARDMAETGDWVTPRLYGKPWFEKPVLYYWGAALCFKLFGVSEVAARLPSAFSALLATLAMAWLAWRVYGAETARWVLLLLPTTVGMIGFSHAAAPDMPFAAMLTVAMVFAARVVGVVPAGRAEVKEVKDIKEVRETEEPSEMVYPGDGATRSSSLTSFTSSISFNSFFFGVFLGLAALAKGPAAIILAGGGVFLWAIFTKRWRDSFRCLHPVGIVSFCLTALPWYVLCARRNPDFFRVFIIEHNFKRYLTPEFQHIQPFWFYIPILIVALLPWTPLLGSKITRSFDRNVPGRPALFFISFVLFCFLFFSLSKSKLPGYILPAVPILGMVIAIRLPEVRSTSFRWLTASCGVVLLSLIAVAVCVAIRLQSRVHLASVDMIGPLRLVPVILLVGGIIVVAAGVRRAYRTSLIAGCMSVLTTLIMVLHTGTNPEYQACALDRFSVRFDVTLFLRQEHSGDERLYSFKLNRSYEYPLNFYLHRELTPWPRSVKPKTIVFTQPSHREELRLLGLSCSDPFFVEQIVEVCSSPDLLPTLSGLGRDGNFRRGGDRQAR